MRETARLSNHDALIDTVRRAARQRNVRPLSTGRMFIRARDILRLDQGQLAAEIGIHRVEVVRYESLVTDLNGHVKRLLEAGFLSYRAARGLTSIPMERQREIAEAVMRKRVGVGAIEKISQVLQDTPDMELAGLVEAIGSVGRDGLAGDACPSCGGNVMRVASSGFDNCVQCGRTPPIRNGRRA